MGDVIVKIDIKDKCHFQTCHRDKQDSPKNWRGGPVTYSLCCRDCSEVHSFWSSESEPLGSDVMCRAAHFRPMCSLSKKVHIFPICWRSKDSKRCSPCTDNMWPDRCEFHAPYHISLKGHRKGEKNYFVTGVFESSTLTINTWGTNPGSPVPVQIQYCVKFNKSY
jgi:hypothetical protein